MSRRDALEPTRISGASDGQLIPSLHDDGRKTAVAEAREGGTVGRRTEAARSDERRTRLLAAATGDERRGDQGEERKRDALHGWGRHLSVIEGEAHWRHGRTTARATQGTTAKPTHHPVATARTLSEAVEKRMNPHTQASVLAMTSAGPGPTASMNCASQEFSSTSRPKRLTPRACECPVEDLREQEDDEDDGTLVDDAHARAMRTDGATSRAHPGTPENSRKRPESAWLRSRMADSSQPDRGHDARFTEFDLRGTASGPRGGGVQLCVDGGAQQSALRRRDHRDGDARQQVGHRALSRNARMKPPARTPAGYAGDAARHEEAAGGQ